MNLINKKIEEIKAYENNPVMHTDEQIEKLANMIKKFGFKQPIVIDKNNIIIAGHGRLEACKQLNYKEIACIIADDLTEEQIKAYRIADNKISELRFWDNDLLESELGKIKDNFKLENLGFSADEIDLLEDTGIEHYFEEGFTSFADEMKNSNIVQLEQERELEIQKKILASEKDKLASEKDKLANEKDKIDNEKDKLASEKDKHAS